jgi:two-component sensor histidine kinase
MTEENTTGKLAAEQAAAEKLAAEKVVLEKIRDLRDQIAELQRAALEVRDAKLLDHVALPETIEKIAANVDDLRAEAERLAEHHRTVEAELTAARQASDDRAKLFQTLIREAHHRIRNNLQSVVTLLEMERQAVDPSSVGALDRCAARIRAIAMVHRLLTTEDAREVPVQSLLKGLSELALAGYQSPGATRLSVTVNDGACTVSSKSATGLAIVINELISNAILHAFSGRTHGRLELSAANSPDGQTMTVVIADDGVGCPDTNTPGTGLRLIRSIVEHDLKGTIHIASGPRGGCHCEIVLPNPGGAP